MEERPVAAVVLDHEKTHKEGGGRHRQQQAQPIAGAESGPRQDPKEGERQRGDQELDRAARAAGLAVAGKQRRPRARIGRAANIRVLVMHQEAAPKPRGSAERDTIGLNTGRFRQWISMAGGGAPIWFSLRASIGPGGGKKLIVVRSLRHIQDMYD